MGVGAAHPRVGGSDQVSVEVDDLHQAMHASIGSTSTQGGKARLIGELAQGALKPVLHRQSRQLALPTLVGPTVVADSER